MDWVGLLCLCRRRSPAACLALLRRARRGAQAGDEHGRACPLPWLASSDPAAPLLLLLLPAATGHEVLSKDVPVEADEVEQLVGSAL